MAKVIEIGIGSEGKAFRQGLERDVIPPLEDAQKALLDMGKDGEKGGDRIEDALRSAQRETKDTKREIEDLSRELEDAGRSGSRIGDGVKAGAQKADGAVREFSEEAKQNLSETVSSFRGEGEDIAQIVQDTFGGVVSSLGPIGMAAGVAGAAGIGLLLAQFEKAQESEEEFREKVRELAEELIETGGIGETSIGYIADQLRELALETDPGALSLAKIRREAERLGLDFKDLATAYAGGTSALEEQIEVLDDLITEEQQRYAEGINQYNQYSGAIDTTSKNLKEQRDALQRVAEATEDARQQEEDYITTGAAALAARGEAAEALQSELNSAIGTWGEYHDAETGATDPAAYISAMQARIDATSNFNSNVQTLASEFGLSFEETQSILDQGVDFAPMLQSIIDSGLSAQFAAQVQAAVGGGQEIIEGTPLGATVTVGADTGDAVAGLDAAAEGRETTIEADPITAPAERALSDLITKKRVATVTAEADVSAARTALNNFVNERRVAVVTVDTRDREGRPVP